jgi:hypothetical protein
MRGKRGIEKRRTVEYSMYVYMNRTRVTPFHHCAASLDPSRGCLTPSSNTVGERITTDLNRVADSLIASSDPVGESD